MKPTLHYLFLFIFFTNVSSFGQTNIMYNNIKEAKQSHLNFSKIPQSFSYEETSSNYKEHFKNIDEISVFTYKQVPSDLLTDAISITIPSKNGDLNLELIEAPESFYNYTVKTSNGEISPSNSNFKHYRGIISNNPQSVVAISFIGTEIMGVIADGKDNLNFVKDSKSGLYLLYSDKNLKENLNFVCSEANSEFVPYKKEILLQSAKESIDAFGTSRCIQLYFETEYDIYTAKGYNAANVEGFISGIFNQVSTLYANETIQTSISEIFIWTSTDPYNASTSATLLQEFQVNRTSFNGALGQLLTFRNVGGGQAASFDGLCNSEIKNRLSVAYIHNGYSSIPTYSWTTTVIAHEFGHLLGSRHTHACVWNGNNTAIDGCAPTEISSPATTPCPSPGVPSGGGTIMSYCHQTSAGINLSLGFGLQPGNIMRNKVNSGTCICTCPSLSGPSLICTTGNFSISNLSSGGTVVWSTSSSVLTINSSGVATRVGSGGQAVTVTATISNECGVSVLKKTVWVGTPYVDITTPDVFCYGNMYSFSAINNSGEPYITGYNWWTTSPNLYLYGSTFQTVSASSSIPGTYYVNVNTTNACGTTTQSVGVYVEMCGSKFSYNIYPNPAKTYIYIEFPEKTSISDLPEKIILYSEFSTEPIKSITLNDLIDKNKIKLDVYNLPRGTYYIHLSGGLKGYSEKSRIILE
jgi:hypothetical protein